MKRWCQQGNGALLMVMLLAASGLLLMTGMQRQLDSALSLTHDERRYWQTRVLAESSLQWGLGQEWLMGNRSDEQCLGYAAEGLQVCLRQVPGEHYMLLRGEGHLPRSSSVMVLYQRVVPIEPDGETSPLKPITGGWLDFCPERQEAICGG
ncbi:YgdB family protein [Symbiopectobacterium purcellii]|uniref:YgdB family protein n=1 Tax=Symbiopectobacterium purcellii TaxID=2871826 RepID=A0ABX9ALZ4_9ENTR|nr:YgdB family protein [Symbiopectobacterium purcellii]QZN95326.1 YgdB family protein [Symbiopectobacterium purcellii]